MRTVVMACLAAMLAQVSFAVEWIGLDDRNHISGPKITPEDLKGKVVMVDLWGVGCPPCLRILPELAKYSNSFSHKPFVLVGSHCQHADFDEIRSVLSKAGVKYSVYQDLHTSVEPDSNGTIPFIYVINRSGTVVYSGNDLKAAVEEAVTAFSSIGIIPENLVSGVQLKRYKTISTRFVLGKNISSVMKKIKKETSHQNEAIALEARQVVEAVSRAKRQIEEELPYVAQTDPSRAAQVIAKYMKTWPEEGRQKYAQLLKDLSDRQAKTKNNKRR